MDTFTHAVSGALLYKTWTAFSPRSLGPATRWALPLAMVVAAAPDVDIFFAPSPVDFLLLHRGITHSLAALPLLAGLMALFMYPLWRKSTPRAWSFAQTYALALSLFALHIYLDCITTYGTMIFLPFSDYRVRFNGMFIIDIWLLIPMILACCCIPTNCARMVTGSPPWHQARRAFLFTACAWMVLYPASTILWRQQIEGQELLRLADQAPFSPTVLPDALSPLHWRILYATEAAAPQLETPLQLKASALPPSGGEYGTVHQQGLNGLAEPTSRTYAYPAADPNLVAQLSALDRGCKVFFRFTLLPLQYTQTWEGGSEYLFYDLRFNTLVPFVRKLMALRRDGQIPFLLRARFDSNGTLVALRMSFSGSNRDSGWYTPEAPHPPTWAQWLVGLR
ncbi:MAG: metal-dependent hydrolase [Desulfovibrionaceae bacterium]